MIWHKKLYLSKGINNKNKIIKNIKNGKLQLSVFVITLPQGNDGILEIYPSYVLLQKIYQNSDLYIVGLAKSKDEANELVKDIIDECYSKTGNFNIKEYIME